MRICICTAVTPGFVAGALTMLHSFLGHNRWFKGDIVIAHAGLDAKTRSNFDVCFDNVVWHQVSRPLTQAIDKLLQHFPDHVIGRFYSLEMFRLSNYERVIFCDSDLLFRASIQPLFERSEPLLCCADAPSYRGHKRDRHSFQFVTDLDGQPDIETLSETFNAGLMLVGRDNLGEGVFSELLSWLTVERWKRFEPTPLNDQLVLNQQFVERFQLLGCEYNYLVAAHAILASTTNVRLHDARVLHFNWSIKPWIPKQTIGAVLQDPALVVAYRWWFDAYCQMLTTLGMREQLFGNASHDTI